MAAKKIEEQDLLTDGIPKAINELSQVMLEVTVQSENNKESELKSKDIEKDLDFTRDEDEEDVSEIRQITFRMAKMCDSKGHIHEAMDLYKKVIKRYKDSNEAKEAKKILTNFAKKFESEGRYHLAQSLYDELFL